MLKQKMRSNYSNWAYRHQVDADIKDYETKNHCTMTREATLDYLFGDGLERYPKTHLDLYLLESKNKTVVNRLNHLWAYPLTILLAPFRYVLYGDIGWNNKTRMGRFILKCCGYE